MQIQKTVRPIRIRSKPRAVISKARKYFLCSAVFWLLAGVLLVQNTATSGAVQGQFARAQVGAASRSMQVTASVIGQGYCRNTVTQEAKLDLKLKLSVKNTSDATLIVCRYCNSIQRVVLSKSLKNANSGDYVYDQHSTVGHLPFPEIDDTQLLSPEAGLFVTLKPGESFAYEYPQSVDITLTDAGDRSSRVSPGRYLLQVKIETWDWDGERRKMLEQRLAQSGSLWSSNIASEPLAISIEKPESTIAPCK